MNTQLGENLKTEKEEALTTVETHKNETENIESQGDFEQFADKENSALQSLGEKTQNETSVLNTKLDTRATEYKASEAEVAPVKGGVQVLEVQKTEVISDAQKQIEEVKNNTIESENITGIPKLRDRLSQLNTDIETGLREEAKNLPEKIASLKKQIEETRQERVKLSTEGREILKDGLFLNDEQKTLIQFNEGFREDLHDPIKDLRIKYKDLIDQLDTAERELKFNHEKVRLLNYGKQIGPEESMVVRDRYQNLNKEKEDEINQKEIEEQITPEIRKTFVYPKDMLNIKDEPVYITEDVYKMTSNFTEKDVRRMVKNKYFEKLKEKINSLPIDDSNKKVLEDRMGKRLHLKLDKEWIEKSPDFQDILSVGKEMEEAKTILTGHGKDATQSRVVAWTKMDSYRSLVSVISSVDENGLPHIIEMDTIASNLEKYKGDGESNKSNLETFRNDMKALNESKTFSLFQKVGLTEKYKGKEIKDFEFMRDARAIGESLWQQPEIILDQEKDRENYKKYEEYNDLREGEIAVDTYLKKYKEIIESSQI